MSIQNNILVIDDNYDICELMKDVLNDEGYNVSVAHNTKMALKAIENIYPHVIILDIWLEGHHMDGIGLLKKLKQSFPNVPIIMISGHANVELAASTMKLGAYDFIEKPFKSEKLLIIVKRALETRALIEANNYLQQNHNTAFKVCLGNSKNAQKLRQEIKSVANSNCRIILFGESGSHHIQIAKNIHDLSHRAHKPFISLANYCAMFESPNIHEIITGSENKQSIFEIANGGTLVLENLQTMSSAAQNQILNILQKESIKRGDKEIHLDVRIIGAFEVQQQSNVDTFIKQRILNEVLYHRLNVKSINIPPLRTRLDDIPILFNHAIRVTSNTFAQINIPEKLYHILTSYEWPGNTQEIYNVAEYAGMLVKIQKTNSLLVEMLPSHVLNKIRNDFSALENITKFLDKDYKSAKRQFDMEYINAQLRRFSNNVARTARFMAVDRAALYRKIRSLTNGKETKN